MSTESQNITDTNDTPWQDIEKKVAAFGIDIYPFEKCKFGKQLGTGTSMTVYNGTCVINNEKRKVAFKEHRKFNNQKINKRDVTQILSDLRHEVKMMKKLKYHPNIVQIFGITFKDTQKPILVVELGSCNLQDYLYDCYHAPVGWFEKAMLCNDVLAGVRGLHEANIVHGDLKAENILIFIKATGVVKAKISDFGFSSTLTSKGSVGGTAAFQAPEMTGAFPDLVCLEKTPKIDIYGISMVTYQIASNGLIPYDNGDNDNEDILEAKKADPNLETLLENLPADTPIEFRDIIIMTGKLVPRERASLDDVELILQNLLRPLPSSRQTSSNSGSDLQVQPIPSDSTSSRSFSFLPRKKTSKSKSTTSEAKSEEQSSHNIRTFFRKTKTTQSHSGSNCVALPLDPPLPTLKSQIGRDRYNRAKKHLKEYAKKEGFDLKVSLKQDPLSLNHPLVWSARVGDADVLILLAKEYGMELNVKDVSDSTPLSLALAYGHVDAVKFLVSELGIDVSSKNSNGWTMLHSAAEKGHDKLVKVLVTELGSDVNEQDKFGFTPLHIAALNGEVEVVKTLVEELGADVSIKNIDGKTAYQVAKSENRKDVVMLLKQFRSGPIGGFKNFVDKVFR